MRIKNHFYFSCFGGTGNWAIAFLFKIADKIQKRYTSFRQYVLETKVI